MVRALIGRADPELARDVANALAAFFAKTPALIKLRLFHCQFVESGLAILFLGLQHCHKTLSGLSVEASNLGGYAADIVSATIPLLGLSSLQLKNVDLSSHALTFLTQNLERSQSTMRILDLSQNSVLASKEAFPLLVECLEH